MVTSSSRRTDGAKDSTRVKDGQKRLRLERGGTAGLVRSQTADGVTYGQEDNSWGRRCTGKIKAKQVKSQTDRPDHRGQTKSQADMQY